MMLVAFAIGLALVALLVRQSTEAATRRSVLAEAGVMMCGVDATLQYSEAQVTPLLAHASHVQFLPQLIPFYAAPQVFDRLSGSFPDYTFRQPAPNPTNLSDRPSGSEADIIESFIAQPKLKSLVTERSTAGGNVLSLSEPVRVTDPACLACHSPPEAAPKTLLDVYGRNNGFGWKLGSVIGAEIVSVPEGVALRKANRDLVQTMAALTAAFVIMLLLLNVMLHVFIFMPVRRIARLASEVSLGNMALPELDDRNRDEIGSLSRAFNRMRRSLIAAIKLLEE